MDINFDFNFDTGLINELEYPNFINVYQPPQYSELSNIPQYSEPNKSLQFSHSPKHSKDTSPPPKLPKQQKHKSQKPPKSPKQQKAPKSPKHTHSPPTHSPPTHSQPTHSPPTQSTNYQDDDDYTAHKVDDTGMLQRKGRKMYNPNIPKKPEEGYPVTQAPEGYISWQTKINSGPDGTVNQEQLDIFLGRDKVKYALVDPNMVDELKSGSRIAYITRANKWRSAGWLSRVDMSYADIDGNPFEYPKKYIVYRSYNNCCYTARIEDMKALYVLIPKPKKEKEEKVKIKREFIYRYTKPTKKTNFPLYLTNKKGDKIVVRYVDDKYNLEKTKLGIKYKTALEDPNRWAFTDGTQEHDLV